LAAQQPIAGIVVEIGAAASTMRREQQTAPISGEMGDPASYAVNPADHAGMITLIGAIVQAWLSPVSIAASRFMKIRLTRPRISLRRSAS